jgi:thiol-disulfide isomerase/thioredoxin
MKLMITTLAYYPRDLGKLFVEVSRCLTVACFFLFIFGTLEAASTAPALNDQEKAIVEELKGLRGVPDDQRGDATKRIAAEIRKLSASALKVSLANNLANLSTEGDFGQATLQDVATTLAEALREQPSQDNAPYLELAQLVRYEQVQVSLDTAQLTAAMATLEANDRDRQRANFTLTDLKGKAWTLKDLRDHVVLVNFWATWCPPCRKEMPDLDALYRRYQDQGLVVLAITDEEPAKVTAFLATHVVSYPILLDPGHRVNEEFHVDGIPKSFVYNREGNLVAQAIDMRTQRQFLALLSRTGLTAATVSLSQK